MHNAHMLSFLICFLSLMVPFHTCSSHFNASSQKELNEALIASGNKPLYQNIEEVNYQGLQYWLGLALLSVSLNFGKNILTKKWRVIKESEVSGLSYIEDIYLYKTDEALNQIAGIFKRYEQLKADANARGIQTSVIDELLLACSRGEYAEMDLESKHMLMPLFFSADMETDVSPYFEKQTTRDLALGIFEKLIKKDSLRIEDLKRQCLKFDMDHKLLPTNIKKMGLYRD